jgi:phage head maturation protease
MSVYDRTYSAQIAPCSADWREAIRNGIDVVDEGRRWTESIAENAFLPTTKPVPVLLSHDESRPVGEVIVRIAHKGWFHVDFKLDASKLHSCVAADRLKVGTPVSIGFRTLKHDEQLAKNGVMRHTLARFDELSILGPGDMPGYPGAKITRIYEPKPATRTNPKPPPAARKPTAAAATAEVIVSRAPTLVEDPFMVEVQRRMDWAERRTGRPANMEDVLNGMRRELHGPTIDDVYAAHRAQRAAA